MHCKGNVVCSAGASCADRYIYIQYQALSLFVYIHYVLLYQFRVHTLGGPCPHVLDPDVTGFVGWYNYIHGI